MKQVGRLFRNECRRMLLSGRTVWIIIGIVILLIAEDWNIILSAIQYCLTSGMRSEAFGSVPLLRMSLQIDRIKLLIVLLLLGIGTGTNAEDLQSQMSRLIASRVKVWEWMTARAVANVFCICVVLFVSIGLWCMLLLPWYPLQGKEYTDIYYYHEITGSFPVVYLLIASVLLGMGTSFCSSVGLALSVLRPGKATAYGIPMFFFYVLYGLTRLPSPVNFYRICSAIFVISDIEWINLIYCVALLGSGILIFIYLSGKWMEERMNHAAI